MVIVINVARDVVGNAISFSVTSDPGRRLVNVNTQLDGFSFSDDFVDPPASRFDRSFRQAGDFSPGLEHNFTVQASDDAGNIDAATRTWVD
jgi:hypothetical protein